MAKTPASPTADVESQSERIKNLSLQDVDTLVERQRQIEVELKHLAEELKITVQNRTTRKPLRFRPRRRASTLRRTTSARLAR